MFILRCSLFWEILPSLLFTSFLRTADNLLSVFVFVIQNDKSMGKRPLRPNKISGYFENPVILCMLLLYAKVNSFMCDYRSILKLVGKVFNVFKSVRFILLHNLFPMGWS